MTDEASLRRPGDKLVLVIDDDDSVRELLEYILAEEGFKFDAACDGEAGLSKVRKLLPDLVILDLMLPRRNGFEVLREMQAGETARIPVIVITGRYADRTTAEMMRQESKVVGFIEKPIKTQALGMSLHNMLKTTPPGPKGGKDPWRK